MKQLIKNYTFDASTGIITCPDFSTLRLDRLLLVVDVTVNTILYNFADPVVQATVSTNTIDLAYDTTLLDATDKLMIFYDVGADDPLQDAPAAMLVGPLGDPIDTNVDSLSVWQKNSGEVARQANNPSQVADIQAGSYWMIPFSTGVGANVVGPFDVGNFRGVSVHTGTFGTSNTISWQVSNDGVNWTSVALLNAAALGTTTPTTSTQTANIILYGDLHGRFFRLVMSGQVAGVTNGMIMFTAWPQSGYPPVPNSQGAVVDATSAGLVNAVTQSDTMIFNGVTFDRARSAILGTNTIGTGIAAASLLAQRDDINPTRIDENRFGNLRQNGTGALHVVMRDGDGGEEAAGVNPGGILRVEQYVLGEDQVVAAPGIPFVALAGSNGDPLDTIGDRLVVAIPGGVVVAPAGGAACTNVPASVASTVVVGPHVGRRGLVVVNDSSATMYLKYGIKASASSFTYELSAGATFEMPLLAYTGDVSAAWSSASGAARVTEIF